MNTRNIYIDNIKGALIFLIVFGHFAADSVQYSSFLNSFYTFIYIFHIPLFVFISGFLSKNAEKNRDTAFTKFLGLYLFSVTGFTFFSDALYTVFSLGKDINSAFLLSKSIEILKDTLFSVFHATGAPWYLLSLIFWRILTPYLKKKRFIFIALLLAVAAGGVTEIGYTLSISRTIVFFPFYLLGYHFDTALFSRLTNTISKWARVLSAFVILAVIFLIQQNVLHLNYQMLYSFSSYQVCGYTFAKGAVIRIFIFALAVVISVCFLCLIPKREIKFTKWGSRSLNIYIWHMFLIPVVGILGSKLNLQLLSVPVVIVISLASCVILSSTFFVELTDTIRRRMNRIFSSAEFVH
jgi:fucose 4-O-acetylase-like acetyltransferase